MKNKFLILVVSMFLASCGGAGTEEKKPSKNPTIKLEKSILYIQAEEGGTANIYKEEIGFKVENLNGNIYIFAKNNNPELIERMYLPIIHMDADSTLTIYAAQPFFTDLKKGTYQGSITLSLCEDKECTKPVPNSTVMISIVYDVL
ncbi:hypothetical protein [Cellvibrio sp. OA-2007]|uniref:hypothetical protein n=1 Tax=Cellvibrio sp. OA-2007 TaxID=529823 RepID=UPI00078270E7|nr:hypothetical protein [Cellvibrio sp. OA-2007]